MSTRPLKSAIVGAGYISDYHLSAIARSANAELVAICDLRVKAAEKLASAYPQAKVYADINEMLDQEKPDVVHILTQPDSHFALASMAIKQGCHVVVEKPVTVNAEEARALAKLADEHRVSVTVNHNFLFSRPFLQLKDILDKGALGPIKSVRVVWRKVLAPVNFGPWNLWMLREPGNILFETGSHSISELLSALGGTPELTRVDPRRPKTLPSGSTFFQRWSITGKLNDIIVNIETAFDEGYEQHYVEVEGMFGVAKADIENDAFTIDQNTGSAYDLERLRINGREGLRRVHHGLRTYLAYAGSKLIKSWKGGPYDFSMLSGIEGCYQNILGTAQNRENSLAFATEIADFAEAIVDFMPTEARESRSAPLPKPRVVEQSTLDAEVLIIGATGFIGKHLLIAMTNAGKKVRALVRNPSGLIGIEPADNCEIVVGDFRDDTVIDDALTGINTVIHLAVAHGNSLQGYLDQDSTPTLAFAEKCLERNIERFIYSGTIDSLPLARAGRIRESDGVDDRIERRNNYAHSKAITEQKLTALHTEKGFPLVIVRPAIVLGAGGPCMHVGIANWQGMGRCTYWGNGRNTLPIVLVDDIVSGIIQCVEAEGIEGRIYNLSAEPCISARDYVKEIEKELDCTISTSTSFAFGHFLGDAFKWLIKIIAKHPDKSRVPSIHDWKCREQHASFDTTAAKNDLGWEPENNRDTIIEKGVREPARRLLKD